MAIIVFRNSEVYSILIDGYKLHKKKLRPFSTKFDNGEVRKGEV